MYFIDCLEEEHAHILELTQIIENMALQVFEKRTIPFDDYDKVLYFIQHYSDAHHHGKEEEILFHDMLLHGGELAEAMIQHGMLIEHDQARFIVSNWRACLDELKNLKPPYAPKKLMTLMRLSLDYADLLQRHAEKENTVAYPFGLRILPQEIYPSLDERTRTFEETHKARRETCLAYLDALKTYL